MEKDLKDILLKDLCARLPYGVKAFDSSFGGVDVFNLVGYDGEDFVDDDGYWYRAEDCKPYLFPLSSMTEEQRKEYTRAQSDDGDIVFSCAIKYVETGADIVSAEYHATDWLNAHHFDYRGLIPKGLAIDATDKNIY